MEGGAPFNDAQRKVPCSSGEGQHSIVVGLSLLKDNHDINVETAPKEASGTYPCCLRYHENGSKNGLQERHHANYLDCFFQNGDHRNTVIKNSDDSS